MSRVGEALLDGVKQVVGGLTETAAKAALYTLYPKEFEIYMVSLELTTPDDKIEDFFTFPINPSSISKVEPSIKSIERAKGAIVVNKTGLFAPQDIVLKGNFGRDFKILIRQKELSFTSLLRRSKSLLTGEELSSTIKNGYGAFKVLQDICTRSNQMIDGRPMRLYFHNFAIGESYLVEVIDLAEDQALSNNMMWNYTLRLKVLTPINVSTGKRLKNVSIAGSQKAINMTVSAAKKILQTSL